MTAIRGKYKISVMFFTCSYLLNYYISFYFLYLNYRKSVFFTWFFKYWLPACLAIFYYSKGTEIAYGMTFTHPWNIELPGGIVKFSFSSCEVLNGWAQNLRTMSFCEILRPLKIAVLFLNMHIFFFRNPWYLNFEPFHTPHKICFDPKRERGRVFRRRKFGT